jgi:hypothetical protein
MRTLRSGSFYEACDADVLLAGWRPLRRWPACPQPAPQNIGVTRLQNDSVVSGFSRMGVISVAQN